MVILKLHYGLFHVILVVLGDLVERRNYKNKEVITLLEKKLGERASFLTKVKKCTYM